MPKIGLLETGIVPLTKLKQNSTGIIRENPNIHLGELGYMPGSQITLLDDHFAYVAAIKDSNPFALRKSDAAKILIETAKNNILPEKTSFLTKLKKFFKRLNTKNNSDSQHLDDGTENTIGSIKTSLTHPA
jgi:Fe2+ transport system protein FeoA